MADGNPTGVNPFNGLSDEGRAAAAFESLWQSGKADSQNPKEAAQLRAERDADKAVEPAAQAPAAPTEPPAAEAAPEGETEQAPEYQSIEDFLEKHRIDPESFYQLPTLAKVAGKDEPVKLADLRKSYQQEADYTRKTQELAEKRKALEAQEAQHRQAIDQRLQQAEALATIAHQNLMGEFQGVDWNALRATNPNEWAVRAQEFQLKNAAIQQQLATIAQSRQQQIAQVLPKERERMLAAQPEWQDNAKFEAARAAIAKYAPTRGITDAELGGLYDHRFMLILHDASRAAALQAELNDLKGKIAGKVQQVRAAPPAPAPGARITRDPKVAAFRDARERMRANPRDEDAQAAAFGALAERLA